MLMSHLHSVRVASVRRAGGGVIDGVSGQTAGFITGQFKQGPVALVELQWISLTAGEMFLTLQSQTPQ